MAEERFKNQEKIIDSNKLARTRFVIVGAGAIGTGVTVALCKMGARDVTVYDFDTVEDHNLATQGHPKSQLGKPKVDSLALACLDYGDCTIKTVNAPWTPGSAVDADVVISCVDNMDVRAALWNYYKGRTPFFIDGRMSAHVYKVFGVDTSDLSNTGACAYYASTLHSQASAAPEPCGEKSIIYTVYLVAGMMVSQVREWLTDETRSYRATEIICDTLNHTYHKLYHQEIPKPELIQTEEIQDADSRPEDAKADVEEVYQLSLGI